MKHIILLLLTVLNAFFAFGQITGTGVNKVYPNYKVYPDNTGVDYLIVFNGIDANTSISYSGTYTSINWYKFSNTTTPFLTGTANNYDVTDVTGYLIVIDNSVKISVWVIDYQNYLLKFNNLAPENNPAEQCAEVNLFLQADIPPMWYQAFNKTTNLPSPVQIDRKFNLSYNTLEWAENDWQEKTETQEILLPQEVITVAAPLKATEFTISGDDFAADLNINSLPTIISELYTPVAVECHILFTTDIREQLHEGDRPESADVTEGSSPLEIRFEAKANEPIATYFNWQIFRDGVQLFSRTEKDHYYKFMDAGIYKVVLTARNQYCVNTDSMVVRITSSDMQVPYAFTPNGDGINDEFRIAYKSLTQFKCWIFNRWGRQIYVWTDPQKGWDGTINGVPVKPGGYIYIIEATGADINDITKKPIKYRKKGIVNLLR
ncbi:MAG: gliding motility-associated C-terminal domain-containing protein [Paludibacter sp.]|jgi:gliding motility-associated-like protein|nr:gliding motility-associated C-terminal domain-containing protein [Paludibacter sp.]